MKLLRSIACFFISIFGGVLLFLCISSLFINSTIISSDYHKNLINKYDIYSRISKDACHSLPNAIKQFYQTDNLLIDDEQISGLIKETITSDFVERLTNPLIEGVFAYISGNNSTLPDINISSVTKVLEAKSLLPEELSSKTSQRISSASLLSYLGLQNISKSITNIKFVHMLFSFVPKIMFPIFIILVFLIFYLCKSRRESLRYILISVLSAAVLSILMVISLNSVKYKTYSLCQPWLSSFSTISQTGEIIIPYILDCIDTLFVFFIKISIFLALIFVVGSIALKKYSDKFSNLFNKVIVSKYTKNKLFILVLIIVTCILLFNTGMLVMELRNETLPFAFQELRGNTSTRVIAANNSSVHSLHVKVVDKKSRPLKMVGVIATGQTPSCEDTTTKQDKTSDEGTAKFNVDKGIYEISFDSLSFPENYEIPQPFVTEVKIPGITEVTVTINEKQNGHTSDFGIIEVQILNENNRPIEGVKLYANKLYAQSDITDYSDDIIYSISNPDGIAVFRVSSGNYELGFSIEIDQNYIKIPKPFNVKIVEPKTLKYTLKLTSK